MGDPVIKMICHCTHCKKASGSTYVAIAIYSKPVSPLAHTLLPTAVSTTSIYPSLPKHSSTQQFKITHGEDHLKTYADDTTESGNIVKRYFCGDCGSPMYGTKSDKDDIVFVTVGTMDGIAGWKPEKEMFCRSRLDWIPQVEGAEQFKAMM